jgi:hypothetical protein
MLSLRRRVAAACAASQSTTSARWRELQPRALRCAPTAKLYCSTPARSGSNKVDQWGNPLYGSWQHSGRTALNATAVDAPAASASVKAAAAKHEAAPAAADLTIEPDVLNTGSTARDHLANERTFLAWARTGVGFVALGVGLSQIEQVRLNTGTLAGLKHHTQGTPVVI